MQVSLEVYTSPELLIGLFALLKDVCFLDGSQICIDILPLVPLAVRCAYVSSLRLFDNNGSEGSEI